MLGKIFAFMVIVSLICGGATGNIENVANGAISGAAEAVNLSISLLGVMCLWSGVIRTLDKAGVTEYLSKAISPLIRLVYPSAYKSKNSLSDIAASFSANLLGMGNAALPIGIRAMKSIKEQGLPADGTASDDMIMFAVLNTTPLQLMPTTLIAFRTAHGSANPFEIILPIWICSLATTVFGVLLCRAMSKLCRKKY